MNDIELESHRLIAMVVTCTCRRAGMHGNLFKTGLPIAI